MFRAAQALLAACLLAPSVLAQASAAPVEPKVFLRSGQVTMCQLGKGCEEQETGGRKYYVMKSEGFVLKVTSGRDQRHGYADVVITNETGTPQQVNPASFRMEESLPRLHRLSYVDPNRRTPAVVFERPEPKPAKERAPGNLPPPEYWTSEEHQQDKQQKEEKVALFVPPPAVKMLHAGLIAPEGTVAGRVYFDKPRTLSGVSVLVALPGALFEFPCDLVSDSKVKKPSKKQRAVEKDSTEIIEKS